jgi:membrane fusion protein (multidrug efflux system)
VTRVAAVIVGVVIVVGAAVAVLLPGDRERSAVPRRTSATALVARGTVSEHTIVQGTLQYAAPRTVTAGLAGTITDLPAVGTQVGFGQALFRIDTQPVLLLRGTAPMWRPFAPGMVDGPDVAQLEAGLQATGFFAGAVDTSFTTATSAAITRLQRAFGETCTPPSRTRARDTTPTVEPPLSGPTCGSLALGTVVFGATSVRVASHRAAVGARAAVGSPVLGVSADHQVVRVDIKLDDQRLATRGTAVTVALPGGASVRGRVASVGAAVEKRQAGGNSTAVVVPTTIALRGRRRSKGFARAPVTVQLTSAQRRNVLSVPVEALVALSDTRFAVEVPGGRGAPRRVPVTTGLFAAGRVVVSGPGLRAGLPVVVPQP